MRLETLELGTTPQHSEPSSFSYFALFIFLKVVVMNITGLTTELMGEIQTVVQINIDVGYFSRKLAVRYITELGIQQSKFEAVIITT